MYLCLVVLVLTWHEVKLLERSWVTWLCLVTHDACCMLSYLQTLIGQYLLHTRLLLQPQCLCAECKRFSKVHTDWHKCVHQYHTQLHQLLGKWWGRRTLHFHICYHVHRQHQHIHLKKKRKLLTQIRFDCKPIWIWVQQLSVFSFFDQCSCLIQQCFSMQFLQM